MAGPSPSLRPWGALGFRYFKHLSTPAITRWLDGEGVTHGLVESEL